MSVADENNDNDQDGREPDAANVRLPVALKIVVVSTTLEVTESLLEMVETMSGASVEVIVSEIGGIDKSVLEHHHPDVLIVDFKLDSPTDLDSLRHIVQHADSDTCVIATAQSSTIDGVRRLMRLGVSDFLPQPINREDLLSALQHAARRVRQSRPSGGGNVITFLHAGGGAGATTLAVNFASSIKDGDESAKVCILDFDVQFGQVAINLDLKGSHGVLDLLEDPERLDAMFLESIMTHHKSGVDVLVAPDVLVALDAIEPEMVVRVIGVAAELYDYVVVDMPLALTPWSQSVLGRSDVAVMVGQLTVPGIRQLRRLAGILTSDGVGDVSTIVVLNRFLGGWKTSVRPKEAEKVLGRPIDYLIANDFKTASACVDQGVPVSEIKKRSAIAKNIFDMTKGILTLLSEKRVVLQIES
ncbi:MAG: AAA family ATPase [Alphaproteobacteria bacterium]|nr:AAA family ATPase [Alphaproteobacteria bacterium]